MLGQSEGGVWDLFSVDRAGGPKWSERPCRGSFRPFMTVQTSPAGRTSLGQVGHIRKCVFVISADVGIRVKPRLSLDACIHSAVLDCCQNYVKINSVVWHVRARFVCFLVFLPRFTASQLFHSATSNLKKSF